MRKLFQQLSSGDQKKGTDWRDCFKSLSGVAACLASSVFKGLVPATSRYVQDRGYTAYQMLFFNDALCVLAALCIIVYNRTYILPTDLRQGLRLLFQGTIRFTSMICIFMSFRLLPPAQVEAIWSASMPVFVLMLSRIFLKEIPTCATILGSVWCIAGVVLLGYGSFVNKLPSTDTRDVILGIVLTTVGSITQAMLEVSVKSLIVDNTPKAKIATYTFAITTFSAGVAVYFNSTVWKLDPLTTTVLASGTITHGLHVLFFYIGMNLVEVNAVTALHQFSAFAAYVLQWAILGLVPTILDGLGLTCVFIGTSSIMIWEALVRWKEDKHRGLMKELNLTATSSNNGS